MGTYVHGDKTSGDDEAVLLLTFEGGAIGLAEESWNKPGGMDDRAEVYGSDGQAYADLLYGNSLRAFSRRGYGYAVEKAGVDGRLVVPDLSGDLELWLSAGNGAFRLVRANRPTA